MDLRQEVRRVVGGGGEESRCVDLHARGLVHARVARCGRMHRQHLDADEVRGAGSTQPVESGMDRVRDDRLGRDRLRAAWLPILSRDRHLEPHVDGWCTHRPDLPHDDLDRVPRRRMGRFAAVELADFVREHRRAVQPRDRHVDANQRRCQRPGSSRFSHRRLDRLAHGRVGRYTSHGHRGAPVRGPIRPGERYLVDDVDRQRAAGAPAGLRVCRGLDRLARHRVGGNGRRSLRSFCGRLVHDVEHERPVSVWFR